jgi:small conductance mechanosensitive channel
MEETLLKIHTFTVQYGLNILAALLILIIGRMAASMVAKLVQNALQKTKLNQTLASFVRNLTYYALMAFVIIAALNKLGVETSSFIAVVGAASLAIGLALQGSLSNFASGVMLIIFHPFKVGDTVEAAGAQGTIEEIQIFNTVMLSPDKTKRIIVPNSKVTADKITVHLTT